MNSEESTIESLINALINVRSKTFIDKIKKLANRDGLKCALCDNPFLNRLHITIDHVIPKSIGGSSAIFNLQLAHSICNLQKGSTIDINSTYFRDYAKRVSFVNFDSKSRKNALEEEILQLRDDIKNLKKQLKGPINLNPINQEIKFNENQVNWDSELWNELARYGLTRLSLNMFRDYFGKYAKSKIN